MNWQTTLSQSEPSIQSRQNQLLNRLATTAYNTSSSSYKVSIGHERVNITEIARPRESSSNRTTPMVTSESRRMIPSRNGANILSLCFMCFVSACLILIAISTMHLLLKTNSINNGDMLPQLVHSTNITLGSLYMLPIPMPVTDTVSNLIIPTYDRTLREFATVICLSIILLNCFCVLIFSIEIYLGCNIITNKHDSHRYYLFLKLNSFQKIIFY